MKVYYLNHEKFQSGDTITALQCAFDLAKNDKSIDTITLLVYQQNQYVPFLNELGFKPMHYKNHIALIEGYQVQIHTVKTYHPSYQFACHPQSEILVAVGVPPKHLEKFEDYSNIKYWVFVPWLMDESREWLSIFEAEDIETGQTKIPPAAADARIVEAIKWLNNTSYRFIVRCIKAKYLRQHAIRLTLFYGRRRGHSMCNTVLTTLASLNHYPRL